MMETWILIGAVVGGVMGLLGGGGTVLLLPLLVYVGSMSPHAAIGTSWWWLAWARWRLRFSTPVRPRSLASGFELRVRGNAGGLSRWLGRTVRFRNLVDGWICHVDDGGGSGHA